MPATEASVDLELFRGYELAAGSYDEVFSAPGVLRPAWQVFLKSVGGITRAEYAHRWEQAQRLLRQNSLAYPDFARPGRAVSPLGTRRPAANHRSRRMAHGRDRAQATRDAARLSSPRSVRAAATCSRWHHYRRKHFFDIPASGSRSAGRRS